ncbi:MAG: hypothetical protein ACYTAS_07335 [Planctomycetota bacterium]
MLHERLFRGHLLLVEVLELERDRPQLVLHRGECLQEAVQQIDIEEMRG